MEKLVMTLNRCSPESASKCQELPGLSPVLYTVLASGFRAQTLTAENSYL